MSAALAEAPVETTEPEAPPIAAVDVPYAAVTEADLKAYKRKVYAEACRVIIEHGWCSESNEYLHRMGLPSKGEVRLPLKVMVEKTVWVDVPAIDHEDALEVVDDDEVMRPFVKQAILSHFGVASPASWTVREEARQGEPNKPEAGDFDFTNGGAAYSHHICEQYKSGMGYCTRRPGHAGHHAVGDGTTIKAAWPKRTRKD